MAAIFQATFLIWILLNESVWISIEISMKFVPKGPINNILALVQIMAWRRTDDNSTLSEPMMVRLPRYICITRPQWVKEEGHFLESCAKCVTSPVHACLLMAQPYCACHYSFNDIHINMSMPYVNQGFGKMSTLKDQFTKLVITNIHNPD